MTKLVLLSLIAMIIVITYAIYKNCNVEFDLEFIKLFKISFKSKDKKNNR